MAHKTATQRVFAVPELIRLVSGHLTPFDLAQCNSVCKDWSRQFEPIFWTHFHLKRHHQSLDNASLKAALIRNLPHIRTVEMPVANIPLLQVLASDSTTGHSTRCTNLKRLDIADFGYNQLCQGALYLAKLLDLNHRLTHLRLLFNLFEYDGLTELFFDLDLHWDLDDSNMPDLKAIIQEASITRFYNNPTATKIKSLRLPSNWYEKSNPLPLLLLESDLLDLESCEVPWFDGETDIGEIEQIVREHCSNLKHLTCPSFEGMRQDSRAVCAFIRGCSGLQSFSAMHFSDGYKEVPSLDSRGIITELVSRHCHTLEDFALADCHWVFSYDQQAILSHCKQLKRFWVMSEKHSPYHSIGFDYMDFYSRAWVCKELTTLGLTLKGSNQHDDEFADLEAEGREAKGEEVEVKRTRMNQCHVQGQTL
ncbi:hypothetical protein BGZ72_008190 [Mortierella alpina]|nr:hypothetical protein BGZ72_008190 [Mortierella alpina]